MAAYPGAWLLSVVLLAATAIPAGVIIYRLDQFEPEPASLIAVALLWGGVVALDLRRASSTRGRLSFCSTSCPPSGVDSWPPLSSLRSTRSSTRARGWSSST